ncbi:MAG: precorrin-6Y C5,15-methyltransferase (decarboxylating) subunit CbiT, partial [Lachnospiraceae bacterium]|nr:precorrin-6Y C5,15-methyltransferase (decarboxylating) subunit CbiT [Lachnospiraceae bacterium]
YPEAYASAVRDCEFIRGAVPMTKEEIRTISLSKLGITDKSIMYDIGAGTGSVSVTAALMCPGAKVYAFERNGEALELIRQNCDKFGVGNVEAVAGDALERLTGIMENGADEGFSAPTHVFIGGSGGRLDGLVCAVRKMNIRARFVVNAITLETLGACLSIADKFPEYADMDIIQMAVSRAKTVGGHHMMMAENPIYIISFGGDNE